MVLLDIRKLTKSFGGLTAVNQLDLSVEKGDIVGLIGPNGAGKTTVFNTISGIFRPTSGKVVFKGQNITGLSPHAVAKKGLVRTFQVTNIFSDLTVLDNIRLGSHIHAQIGFLADLLDLPSKQKKEKALLEKASEIADFVGLGDRLDESGKNLSHGHQRALELAIALASNPELLLLDEPVAGMSVEETEVMMNNVRRAREKGISILLVEHDMKMIMGLCDKVCVLNFGKKLAEGTPAQICSNPEVIAAYLGSEYVMKC
jgi:branched-chain amino acid transport system ATP-binding protein